MFNRQAETHEKRENLNREEEERVLRIEGWREVEGKRIIQQLSNMLLTF